MNTFYDLLSTAVPFISPVILLIVVGITAKIFSYFTVKQLDAELLPVKEERQEIKERLRDKTREESIDTLQLGLNQLAEYYATNKHQGRQDLIFGFFALVGGLLVMASGLWFFYLGTSPNIELTAIASLSGTVLLLLSGISFFTYKRSLANLHSSFDAFAKMYDTLLAIRLAQELPDEQKHVQVMETVILTLLGSNPIPPGQRASTSRSLNGVSVHMPTATIKR
jgi:hypothetical protein